MFTTQLVRRMKFPKTARQFRSTAKVYENKPAETPLSAEARAARDAKVKEEVLGAKMYTVNNFDKRMLVMVKRYPNMESVPDKVTQECILTARSKARIYTCNVMAVIFVIVFLYSIYIGKRELKAGRTIHQVGLERYNELRRLGEEERMQKQAKAE